MQMREALATRLWRVDDSGPKGGGSEEMHDSLGERILPRAGPIRGIAGD